MTKRLARHTPTKTHRVSLPPPRGYGFGLYAPAGSTRFTTKSDALAGDYQTEDWGRTWERIVRRYVYIDGLSVDEVADSLRDQAEGLNSATLDIDRNDDGYPEVNIIGRREATEEEVAEVLRFIAWDTENRQERERTAREHVIKNAKALGIKPEDLA